MFAYHWNYMRSWYEVYHIKTGTIFKRDLSHDDAKAMVADLNKGK